MDPARSPFEVIASILEKLVHLLGYKAALVRQLDAEARTLVLTGAYGLSAEYLSKGTIAVEKSGLDREVMEGRVVEITDITHDQRFQYPEAALHEGIGSVIAAPLSLQSGVIGVLRVYSSESRAASETENHFVQAVGKLIARALINSQRFEALRNFSGQINSSLGLQDVLTTILRRAVEELNYRGGIIRLLDPTGERLELVAATGLSQIYLNKGEVEVANSPVDRTVLQGRAATVYDVAAEPDLQYPVEALQEGIRSLHAVPLIVPDRPNGAGKVIGVMRVYSSQPHRFAEDEAKFLQTIANLGAIAIENARLHDQLQGRVDCLQPDEAGWQRIK